MTDTIEAVAQAAPTKAVDMFDMPVHPAAAVFPMLGDDELAELAADIKAHGLRHPLVVKDGVLIDGRCRREACRRAGIAPATTELAGDDVKGFIASVNIHRRHLNKGQRAVVIAKLYPEPKRGVHSELNSSTGDFDKALLSHARTVLKWSPLLADAVLTGHETLSQAYASASATKKKADKFQQAVTNGTLGELSAEAASKYPKPDFVKVPFSMIDELEALVEKARFDVWDDDSPDTFVDVMAEIENLLFFMRKL